MRYALRLFVHVFLENIVFSLPLSVAVKNTAISAKSVERAYLHVCSARRDARTRFDRHKRRNERAISEAHVRPIYLSPRRRRRRRETSGGKKPAYLLTVSRQLHIANAYKPNLARAQLVDHSSAFRCCSVNAERI